MQVGNGDFAFGADVTSLQTFLPFATMSSRGWKNDSPPPNRNMEDVHNYKGESRYNHGRLVQYDFGGDPEIEQWLTANLNQVNLGIVGLHHVIGPKFHMEEYFWHSAHWAPWSNWDLLRRSSNVYTSFLPTSPVRYQIQQGWSSGAHWPKMTDPSCRVSPGKINNLSIWEHPHPLVFATIRIPHLSLSLDVGEMERRGEGDSGLDGGLRMV
ncbi:hypothetical protein HHX47_DHR9000442 [Lentinula edodes]|nr:hypothetical protein HHX47_DHR9000442 [Lentinula edodes]